MPGLTLVCLRNTLLIVFRKLRPRMKRLLPALIIVGVLVAAVGGGAALLRASRPKGVPANKTPTSPTLTTTPVPAPAASPVAIGSLPAGVSVTLEEFGDYQCPPCGLLHPVLTSIKAEYGNHLNFVFRNLPLSKIHKNAQAAAQAAEAARLQDRFWPMHDILYEHQNDWKDVTDPRPVFFKYASEIGLDMNRFERDEDSTAVRTRIDDDSKRAESLGVTGTPTLLIEGRQLRVEAMTLDGIRQGVQVMLSQRAQGVTSP